MARYRNVRRKFFFEGKTLKTLHTCIPTCELSNYEEETWEELKLFIEKQPYSVWCTPKAWDNFVRDVIKRHGVYYFIEYMEKVVSRHPAKMYNLTIDGKIKPAD